MLALAAHCVTEVQREPKEGEYEQDFGAQTQRFPFVVTLRYSPGLGRPHGHTPQSTLSIVSRGNTLSPNHHGPVRCSASACQETFLTERGMNLYLNNNYGITLKVLQNATRVLGSSSVHIKHREKYGMIAPAIRKSGDSHLSVTNIWPPPQSESWFKLMLLVREVVEYTELECWFDVLVYGMLREMFLQKDCSLTICTDV